MFNTQINPVYRVDIRRHGDDLVATAGPQEESPRPELVELTAAHRKFTADDEASHLYRILSICDQYLTDDAIRDQLRDLRKRYQDAFQGTLDLKVNGRQMDGGEALDRWTNGDFLHSGSIKSRNWLK